MDDAFTGRRGRNHAADAAHRAISVNVLRGILPAAAQIRHDFLIDSLRFSQSRGKALCGGVAHNGEAPFSGIEQPLHIGDQHLTHIYIDGIDRDAVDAVRLKRVERVRVVGIHDLRILPARKRRVGYLCDSPVAVCRLFCRDVAAADICDGLHQIGGLLRLIGCKLERFQNLSIFQHQKFLLILTAKLLSDSNGQLPRAGIQSFHRDGIEGRLGGSVFQRH